MNNCPELNSVSDVLNVLENHSLFSGSTNSWQKIELAMRSSSDFFWEVASQWNIGVDFALSNCSNVYWEKMTESKYLNETKITAWAEFLDWDYLSENFKMSENCILENKKYINWDLASSHQYISLAIASECENLINWKKLSCATCVSEAVIEKFETKMDWKNIFSNARLSFEFLVDNSVREEFNFVLGNPNIDPNWIKQIEQSKSNDEGIFPTKVMDIDI